MTMTSHKLARGSAPGSLTYRLTEELRRRIETGAIQPGDKLPTERALVDEFGVSRTVVREAIAGLRADRLVAARQGAGVFVLNRPVDSPILPPIPSRIDRISSIIEALELRTAVEIEAAALAATRSSPAQQMRVREAFTEFAHAVERGEGAEDADFAFHLSIADATNNALFREFLESLGKRTIPRNQIRDVGVVPLEYLQRILDEHSEIAEAICSCDAETASAAMRLHLRGSQERYKRLMYERP
ncbi:MAG TPA: FadR/GntR family transcriptional regulator [Hyphomicrobiales bacterium]|nr:FadR/GntR family transcriptional regulator [Hyphomicrobiales bacterium]